MTCRDWLLAAAAVCMATGNPSCAEAQGTNASPVRERDVGEIRRIAEDDIVRNPRPAIAALPPLIERATADRAFPVSDLALARATLAYARVYNGELDAGLAEISALVEYLAARRPVDEPLLRDALLRRGVILGAMGRHDEAWAVHDANRAALEAAGVDASPLYARTLNSMAIIRVRQGRYPEALALSRRSVAIYRTAPGAKPLEVGDAWRTLVVILDLEGLNAEAIEQGQQAVTYIGANLTQDSETYSGALGNLGSQLADAGRLSEAEAIFRRQIEIEERQTSTQGQTMAISLSNLGSTLISAGNPAGAEPILRKARELFVAAGKRLQRPDFIGITIHSLALSVAVQGRHAEARELMHEALAELESRVGKEHPTYANVQSSIARSLLEDGDNAAAHALLTPLITTVREQLDPDSPIRLTIEFLAGEAKARVGNAAGYAEARAAIARDRRRLVSATLDPLKSGLLAQERADNFTRFARLALERGENADAFEALQLAMLGDLDSAGAGWLARQRANSPEVAALMRAAQDAARKIKRAQAARTVALAKGSDVDLARADADLVRVRAEAATHRSELEKLLPDYAEIVRPEPVALSTAQAALGEREGLLLAVPDRAGIIAMLIDRTGITSGFSSTDSARVQALATSLRAGIEGALLDPQGAPSFDAAAAHELYRAIFPDGVAQRVGSLKTLAFQTGGVLSSVPLAALVTRTPRAATLAGKNLRAAPWLVRHLALWRPVTLAALSTGRARARSTTRVAGIGAPALGPAKSGSSLAFAATLRGSIGRPLRVDEMPTLPQAPRELATIASTLDRGGALLLTGAQATEQTVAAAPLHEFNVVVFATHGLVSGEMRGLSEPALVLTPAIAPDDAPLDAANDGLLTASEISQLKLDADWVILSACNTSAGEGGAAPIFTGLARAFVHAGARSLLLSQWPLDDRAAAAVTVDAVKQVARGASRAEALRAAQLALLRSSGVPAHAHPAYWAGFALLGM